MLVYQRSSLSSRFRGGEGYLGEYEDREHLADHHGEYHEECDEAVALEKVEPMFELRFIRGGEAHGEGLDRAVGVDARNHRKE